MAKFLPFVCVLLVAFSSCTEGGSEKTYNFSLKLSGEYQLPIDSLTSVITTSTEIFIPSKTSEFLDSGVVYLCLENRGRLQFYDLNKKELKHTLSFKYQGPNSISSSMRSFDIINQDSILISTFPAPFIYLVNINGSVLSRFQINNVPKAIEASTTSANPMVLIDNSLFLGFLSNVPPNDHHSPLEPDEIEGIVLEKSLIDSSQQLRYYFTEPYQGEKLYSMYYYMSYINYDATRDNILISLGADDSITVTDFKTNLRRFYAGSDLFNLDEVKGLSKKDKDWDHYRLNFMYEGIIYDKYKECYYRFISHPKSEEQITSSEIKEGRVKEYSVIVLNNQFEKIAESVIPADYCDMSYFITDRGLFLYSISMAAADEDNIYFGVFSLEENTSEE